MKILLVGSDWYGGVTEYCEDALNDLGHTVRKFYYEKDYASLSLLGKIQARFIRTFQSGKDSAVVKMNAYLLKEALVFKPDMILIIKGQVIFPETLAQIKAITDIPIVSWWIDDPLLKTNGPYILRSAKHIDYMFIFDPFYIGDLIKAGFKKTYYLPFACSPKIHKKNNLSVGEIDYYSSDVSFLGIISDFRQEILRQLLDFDLKIWGMSYLSNNDEFKKYMVNRLIPNKEAINIYNASKIVLNINHPQSVSATNTRTFEAVGCGAFHLTDDKKEIHNLFSVGTEIDCYEGISDLRGKIKYYLNNPDKRQEIASRGQERAYREHTYVHRMESLLKIVNL